MEASETMVEEAVEKVFAICQNSRGESDDLVKTRLGIALSRYGLESSMGAVTSVLNGADCPAEFRESVLPTATKYAAKLAEVIDEAERYLDERPGQQVA